MGRVSLRHMSFYRSFPSYLPPQVPPWFWNVLGCDALQSDTLDRLALKSVLVLSQHVRYTLSVRRSQQSNKRIRIRKELRWRPISARLMHHKSFVDNAFGLVMRYHNHKNIAKVGKQILRRSMGMI